MTRLNILIVDYTTHHPEVVTALGRLFAGHNVRFVLTPSFVAKFGGDIAGRQAFLSILKMLWYRRRRGRHSDLRFFSPRSRFPQRRLLLRLLADIT